MADFESILISFTQLITSGTENDAPECFQICSCLIKLLELESAFHIYNLVLHRTSTI